MADTQQAPTQSQIRVRDPLSDVTRKERRALLAASLIGVTTKWTGLLPTEIDALGLKFASTDHQILLRILALVNGYFLLAFFLYAASDFIAWRLALRESIREASRRRRSLGELEEQIEQQAHDEIKRQYPLLVVSFTLVSVVSTARAIFEFLLPCVFGVFAIVVLLI